MSLFVKRDLRGRNADPTVWRYLHEAEAEIDRLQITLAAAQERIAEVEQNLAHWKHCHGVTADRLAEVERERDSAQDEVTAGYDAIFAYVPEALGDNGQPFTLADKINMLADRAQAAEARCAELREALQPFTHDDLCKQLGGNVEGDNSPVFGREKAILRLGDFRRARAALKESSK